ADVGEDEINRLAAEPDDIRDQEERSEAAEALSSAYEHHEAMNDLMQQLRSIDPAAPDYSELLAELEDMFVEHVTEEEDVLLPIVSATLDVQALGFEMQRRKDDVGSQPPLAA
ncbi:MAG TPA: hemerythrin domain-containing protein, partial [Nitrospira sp.]|nr:hemerythrin domain-containing protein [Nitrospira sp.]